MAGEGLAAWPAGQRAVEIFHAVVTTNVLLHFIVPTTIGVSTVLTPILVNHAVRIRRIKLIHGFAKAFSPARRRADARKPGDAEAPPPPPPGPSPSMASGPILRREQDIRYSPSLEFVVTKYVTDLDENLNEAELRLVADLEFVGTGPAPETTASIGKVLRRVGCFSLAINRRMVLYSMPCMAVVACGFSIVALALHERAPSFTLHRTCPTSLACGGDLVPISIVFFAGYLSALTIIIRAVTLFDLSAMTFLRVVTQILGAVFSGFIFWLVATSVPGVGKRGEGVTGMVYLMLFGIGFVPDAGTRYLLSSIASATKSPSKGVFRWFARLLQFMKLTDGRFAATTRSIPLDVIDGIDFFTRYRLEEAGIYEVQNLAVANPILLHVETPFGIYATIDWVGQAQLCTVVGPERFVILRQFNVRTVFDLERAVLSLKATSEIRRIVGGILLMPTDTLRAIEKECGLTFPNMDNPRGAAFSSEAYAQWTIDQAMKPSTYRAKLPRPPQKIVPSSTYRVYPGELPGTPTKIGDFTIVGEAFHDEDGVVGPTAQAYDVYEFQDAQDATIKHIVRLIMDDLHVMRLRQIWESIGRTLGGDAATLDDSEDTFLGA